jgi:FkbM family methyltransferase
MISYSQNGEDVLLERLFHAEPAGFYIDVGASDPVELSVTKHFYDRGWQGINIEPGKEGYDRLCAARPRDCNLHLGLGECAGEFTYYALSDHSVLSTFCADQARRYREAGADIVEGRVPMSTLAQICADHVRGPIHFMSIDVEGYERQVLLGADWTRWRPAVLLIEATEPNTTIPSHEPWEPLVLHAGYRFAYFDGQNRFYVRAENPELLEAFRGALSRNDAFCVYPRRRQNDDLHRLLCDTQEQLIAAKARLREFETLGPSALQMARLLQRSAARFPRLARRIMGLLKSAPRQRETK